MAPWGHPYVYLSPGQHSPDYDLTSFGADGLEGGEGYNADLESWWVHEVWTRLDSTSVKQAERHYGTTGARHCM